MPKDIFNETLKRFPAEQRRALEQTISYVETLFPKATKAISWGMPTLVIGKDNLCHVMGFKNHNSLFPSSGAIASLFKEELAKFEISKGTIKFEIDKPFPKALLKKILLARIDQINDSYPKKNGLHVEYYQNGGVKNTGKYKGTKMHGSWEFFRLDGSLMRKGSFKEGVQAGTWITYDSKGKKVKETHF